jgi:hypothetical protein
MIDTHVYVAGDTLTARIVLEAKHEVPSCIWVTLTLDHAPVAASESPAGKRATSLTLQTSPSMSDPVDSNQTIFPLDTIVPKYIVGGTYRASGATFFMPDGRQLEAPLADDRGEFMRRIADDTPAPYDTPVVSALE